MTFSQVIILGAGAIGSAFGAYLSVKNKVTLIGRPVHMDAIKENGLTVLGDGAGIYHMETATQISEVPPQTLLIVAVKATDLKEALLQNQSMLRNDTVILLCQNGLDIEKEAKEALNGSQKIVRGIVTIGSEILEPGRIQVKQNYTFFDSDERSKLIVQFFKNAGLSAEVTDSFQTDIWRKVTINCVANPLSAILRARTTDLVSPLLEDIRKSVVEECIAVGKAEGVDLDLSILQIIKQSFPQYTNRTSMFQDIILGRKTEIEFLNGKIVELGKTHNIAVPVNESLTQLIRYLESVKN